MPYIPKTISHSEKVELLKQEVLRLSKMGLSPRHIATKLEIPPYSVYNYKTMLQKEGYDVSPKLETELSRAEKIVKTKVLKHYNQAQVTEELEIEVELEQKDTQVFIPLLAEERQNVMISFSEEGITVTW